jgi:hypothetical protein
MQVTELEVEIGNPFRNRRSEVAILNREHPLWKARLATTLLERWGPVLAAADGEDSTGRQKIRDLSPEEIVAKACEIADLSVDEFRSRGWVIGLPSLAEVEAHDKTDKA